ncbi:hypothetical protein CPC08DRAFT_709998 [Agrocybe pediades]|nr:hypothetical protein CPC08DRAFT_709998 [Agrocybe pediades]
MPFRQSNSSRLPYELERDIFEIAASVFPETITAIVLVARRFRIWFEPELYRVVRSGEDEVIVPPLYKDEGGSTITAISMTSATTLDIPRLQKFGPHVWHVILQRRHPEEIEKILECCPNVRNLALWIVGGSCTRLIPLLNDKLIHLRRLSLDPSCFFENYDVDLSIPLDQPMFHRLTHLEIVNATSSWSKWRQLAFLPHLTHLALAGVASQELIDSVLMECEKLEIFVIFYMHRGFLGGDVALLQKDIRVVLLQSVADHLDHWERGARGEEDFWIAAEQRKRQALMQAISFS